MRFLDRELLPLLVDSTRELAAFIGCAAKDVVLTANVTTGLNAVFKSLATQLKPTDVVLRLDLAYGPLHIPVGLKPPQWLTFIVCMFSGSVKKMLVHYMSENPHCRAAVLEVVIPVPITADTVRSKQADLSHLCAHACMLTCLFHLCVFLFLVFSSGTRLG